MAGYDNIRHKGFEHRTIEGLREITSRVGKTSGSARLRKSPFHRSLNLLLITKIYSPQWTPLLEALRLVSTLARAVNAALLKES